MVPFLTGLRCLTCDNAPSHDECRRSGKVVECLSNEVYNFSIYRLTNTNQQRLPMPIYLSNNTLSIMQTNRLQIFRELLVLLSLNILKNGDCQSVRIN